MQDFGTVEFFVAMVRDFTLAIFGAKLVSLIPSAVLFVILSVIILAVLILSVSMLSILASLLGLGNIINLVIYQPLKSRSMYGLFGNLVRCVWPVNTKGESITVPLTSCLTCLD